MLPFVPLGPRSRVAAALAAAAGCGVAAIAGIAACLTAPPADIGTSTSERPEIVPGGVQPPQGLLDEYHWPVDGVFVVPVIIPDPTASCTWRVFDVDVENPPPPGQVPPLVSEAKTGCTTTVSDGGVALQDVPIRQPGDGHCHVFEFIVAHGFDPPPSQDQPDSIGGDSVSWSYSPSNGLCRFVDAGAFQDGGFPAMDAGADGLPVTPESGPPDAGIDP